MTPQASEQIIVLLHLRRHVFGHYLPAGLVSCAVAVAGLLLAPSAIAQPYGIDTRASNTTLLIDGAPDDIGATTPVPAKLSDVPALLAAGLGQDQTAAGILPYRPSTELWSDGALKSRFIALPGLTQMTYRADGGWAFPDGSTLIKNFSLPQDFRDPAGTAVRIETRILVKLAGAWTGYTYQWNAEQTDATLVDGSGATRNFNLTEDDGSPLAYTWTYPARSDCFQCHNTAAKRVLGINAAQMNHDYLYPGSGVTDNQVRTFEHLGLFDAALPATIPASPDAKNDLGASTKDRARAYLHANCAICHRPGGPAPTSIDARWGTAQDALGLINVSPTISYLGLPNPFRVAPGDPENSVLYLRMALRGQYQMPPIASTRVDKEAVALVSDWITELGAEVTLDTDQDGDHAVSLSELLRVIQFYNSGGLHCEAGTEDNFGPGAGSTACTPYGADYAPQDWAISLSELLRYIQFYNSLSYHYCPTEGTEDGFCPG